MKKKRKTQFKVGDSVAVGNVFLPPVPGGPGGIVVAILAADPDDNREYYTVKMNMPGIIVGCQYCCGDDLAKGENDDEKN